MPLEIGSWKASPDPDKPSHAGSPYRRRGFTRMCAALGAAALVVMLGACSGSVPGSGASGNSSAGGKSATLTAGTPFSPTSFDPAEGDSGYDYSYLYLMYATLIHLNNSNFALSPGLASSWAFAGPNKDQFNITLRQGITFQDGTPVNAAAVKTSLQHFQAGVMGSWLSTVKSIDVTGPYTLTLNLSGPSAGLPGMLADRAGMIVSPTALKKYGKNFAQHPVGAGPYQLTSYTPNNQATFKRYSGYKPIGGVPANVAQIVVKIFSSTTALANALTSNVVQYAWGIDPSDVPTLKSASGLTVKVEQVDQETDLVFDLTIPAVQNPKVRLAIEYAIDRQAMANAIEGNGIATPSYAPYPPSSTFGQASMTFPYNPAKAKQLLAQAGYSGGLTLKAIAPNIPPYTLVSTIAQADLAKVGIHLQLTEQSAAAAIPIFSKGHAYSVFFPAWNAFANPYLTYFGILDSQSAFDPHNATYAPGMDQLISQLNSSYTTAEQIAVIHKINALTLKYAPWVPLYYEPEIVAYGKGISGEQPSVISAQPDLALLSVS
jgi:peptide/nickel transport system substrate-binding protein